MRKITFNLYELDNLEFINSSLFEAFTATTFLNISIDKAFLYNRFLDKYGKANINEEMPGLWLNKLKRHLATELVILNKQIDAFNNSINSIDNLKQVYSQAKNYIYSKAPISLDVEGNENYYNNLNVSENYTPTTTDFEAYQNLKNTYYNIIDEFLDNLEGWFLWII